MLIGKPRKKDTIITARYLLKKITKIGVTDYLSVRSNHIRSKALVDTTILLVLINKGYNIGNS